MTSRPTLRNVAWPGTPVTPGSARRALADPNPAVRATALAALERLGVLADRELAVASGRR